MNSRAVADLPHFQCGPFTTWVLLRIVAKNRLSVFYEQALLYFVQSLKSSPCFALITLHTHGQLLQITFRKRSMDAERANWRRMRLFAERNVIAVAA